MKHYLFPKYFNQFSADELMEKCVKLGIDGPTLMIREGYWVDDNNYRETIPAFVATAKAHGLEVKYADTNICMDKIDEYVDQLKVMKETVLSNSDCGTCSGGISWDASARWRNLSLRI